MIRNNRVFTGTYPKVPCLIKCAFTLISLSFVFYPIYLSAEEPQFLNYSLSDSEFPKKLKPLVGRLAKELDKESANYALAEQQVIKALSSFPRGFHDELYFVLGFVREKAKKFPEAIKAYDMALERRARDPKLIIRKAISLKNMKKCKGAVEQLNEARWWLSEPSFEIELLLAECFFRLDQPKKAEKLLDSAHFKNPNYLPVKRLLLETKLRKISRSADPISRAALESEVAVLLEQINILDPGNAKVAKLYSKSALKKIDPVLDATKLAVIETRLAEISKSSDYKDEEAVTLYLEALRKAGKHEFAKDILDKALKSSPESSLLLDAQAQLQIELGGEY